RGDALEGLEGGPAAVLADDRGRRDATLDRQRPGRCGFRRQVAVRLAPGHDEERRETLLVEVHRVSDPRGEDSRRPAVVLGRAEDDDRVGLARLVAMPDVPDPVAGPADEEERTDDRREEQPGGMMDQAGRGWSGSGRVSAG